MSAHGLKPGERLAANTTAWYTEEWCDGSGNLGPCSCADTPSQKGHWRSGRRITMEQILLAVAERQKAAMIAAINDDSYAAYEGGEVVSILKAVPLVTEGETDGGSP